MFKKLTDFGYKRTALEAFGFYLAYFVLIILAAAFAGGVMGVLLPEETALAYANSAGICIALIMTVGLAILVLYEKKLHKDFRYIALVLIIGFLALFTAALGGLIPVAFLTTRGSAKKAKKTKK